jgi:hypothetical protein
MDRLSVPINDGNLVLWLARFVGRPPIAACGAVKQHSARKQSFDHRFGLLTARTDQTSLVNFGHTKRAPTTLPDPSPSITSRDGIAGVKVQFAVQLRKSDCARPSVPPDTAAFD